MSETRPFALNVNDEDFKQRQKNVFDQLGVLEKNRTNNQMDVETPTDSRLIETSRFRTENKADRTYMKQFRGKESIFKKPANGPPRNFLRRVPDFKKNPHKWTKYSLEDVREEDMSDKGNTQAALSFLKEIKDRKNDEMKMEEGNEDNRPPKMTYRKVFHTEAERRSGTSEEMNDDQTRFSSSKVVMPEYVVGQKVKKEKKKGKVEKGKELKLDHLLEEEDE